MGRSKLDKFADLKTYKNVHQPEHQTILQNNHPLKGKWSSRFFHNNNPVVLELGCGKGEYTVALAREHPENNFIGIDIKGARIWTGATEALEEDLPNAAFLRTRIEFINAIFAEDEIREIWLTFPDPQEKKRRRKKRLTSSHFLNLYRQVLVDKGTIHLKTDNPLLFNYTKDLIHYNKLPLMCYSENIYQAPPNNHLNRYLKDIKTFYEKSFLEEGRTIYYIQFCLPKDQTIEEVPEP